MLCQSNLDCFVKEENNNRQKLRSIFNIKTRIDNDDRLGNEKINNPIFLEIVKIN